MEFFQVCHILRTPEWPLEQHTHT